MGRSGGSGLGAVLLAAAAVGAVAGTARADVAPTPWARSAAISPGRLDAAAVGGDSGVDVEMAAERVEIDVYPTLVAVRAVFTLRAGARGAAALPVGFPERLPRAPGHPLEDLEVAVDGSPVAPRLEARRVPLAELSPGILARVFGAGATRPAPPAEPAREAPPPRLVTEAWWLWTTSFAPRQERRIEVRYAQPLCDWGEEVRGDRAVVTNRVDYTMITGRAWRGPIGVADVVARVHGIPPAAVESSSWPPTARVGHELRWRLERAEPELDVGLDIALPAGAFAALTARPPLPAARELALFDQAVRLVCRARSRGRAGTEAAADQRGRATPEHEAARWRRFVRELRAAAQDPAAPRAQAVARRFLTALHDRARDWHPGRSLWIRSPRPASCLGWLAPPGVTEPQRRPAPATTGSAVDYRPGDFFAAALARGVPDGVIEACALEERSRRLRGGAAAAGLVLVVVLAVVVVRRRRRRAGGFVAPPPPC